MATAGKYSGAWTFNGVQFNKPLDKMNDAEWNDAFNRIKVNQSRLGQITSTSMGGAGGGGSNTATSTNNTYANNGSSSNTQTSSNFGGDWTQGNSNFGFDNMLKQAKDMAQFQLDNAGKQMELSYTYRNKEAERDYGFQRGINEQRNAFDVARMQLAENFRQNEVNDNRAAANALFFGRQRGRAGRRF